MKKIIIFSMLAFLSIALFNCGNQYTTTNGSLTDEQILILEERIQNGEAVTIPSTYYFEMPSGRIKLKTK